LYQALRVETRKVSRNKVAKLNAEEAVEELQEKMEQLTFKNQQLEMTMSQLVENWANLRKFYLNFLNFYSKLYLGKSEHRVQERPCLDLNWSIQLGKKGDV
jgi:predicted choloylglycine hydrolase